MSQQNEHIDVLLQQCLAGKQSAQFKVYQKYQKAMYNTSLRIVKDSMEAEDVMQESFLSAFSKLHSFKGEVTFGAWLKRIVVNNSIQRYNKRKKENSTSLEDHLYRVEDDDVGSQDYGETERKAQKVLQTMNLLKENYRVSLTLHLIEGYDYDEISQIMDMSYANCRTTISRAKDSLRKKMAQLV
ncbi:RNA polymerase sigma factor [Sediminicola luteus]|uniref:RNA polymerase subunit sigma n=1 Tax=Sediminicola luteus TaxID=319238 RepID=A0A2A4G9D1_9FLAO|nr:RNA polymerase sigma factor [Sediminicola luteus]PCE65021.1 RNA polymerase subunit sigma [Sediminicola luteus]